MYYHIKNKKIENIQKALDFQEMPTLEKSRLNELMINELYQQATKLKASPEIRPFAIDLIKNLSFDEQQINYVYKYFVIKRGQVEIDITSIEWCFLFLSKWVFIMLATFSIVVFCCSFMFIKFLINHIELMQSALIAFIVSALTAFMYFFEARKYRIICDIYGYDNSIFKSREPSFFLKCVTLALFFLIIILHFLLL